MWISVKSSFSSLDSRAKRFQTTVFFIQKYIKGKLLGNALYTWLKRTPMLVFVTNLMKFPRAVLIINYHICPFLPKWGLIFKIILATVCRCKIHVFFKYSALNTRARHFEKHFWSSGYLKTDISIENSKLLAVRSLYFL